MKNFKAMTAAEFKHGLSTLVDSGVLLDNMLLTAIDQVANSKHNTNNVNAILKLELCSFKNKKLKKLGSDIKSYIVDIVGKRLEWRNDNSTFQFNSKVDLTLDLNEVQVFSVWQESVNAKKESDKKQRDAANAEKTAAVRDHRENLKILENKDKELQKAIDKKQAAIAANAVKAESGNTTEKAIAAATADILAKDLQATIGEHQGVLQALNGEALALERANKDLLAAGDKVSIKALTLQLQKAAAAGITGSTVDAAACKDALADVLALVLTVIGDDIQDKAAVDTSAADSLNEVKPSSRSKAAGKKKAA